MVLTEGKTEIVNDSSLKIDDAVIEDISSIMEIQRSELKIPENLTEKEAKQGFLVYEVGDDELKTLITGNIKHVIKVARKNGNVTGYFIAYDMQYYLRQHSEWINEFEENPKRGLKQIFKDNNVLFSKQLALSSTAKGTGLGDKLWEAVYQDAVVLGFRYEVGEVLAEPIQNSAMEALVFGKLKFNLAGYRTDKNNRKWTVITRTLK
ncbi:MAG: hypothetical protein AAB441_05440 [Patescibacteria group bacterium]